VAEQILSGAETARSGDTRLFARATGEISSPWRLVTAVPGTALDAASGDLKGEYAWVIGSMLLTTLILIAVGVFLVRMSVRELRLREAARYEQQQKQMERQMQVAERLGSLGLLTAGVAHEINNPLEGIENYLALLERDPASPEKRRRYVEMVRYWFHRIRDIVRDLSTFARPGVAGTRAELGDVVAHALRMVAYTKDFKAIRVHQDGLASPLAVAGDRGRLEQVFLNLFLNAARAMKGRGDLTVRARALRGSGEGPGQVEVIVEDTGPGIPEDSLDKIFDPFFTTTDGIGLGLSISYGIVRAHGGLLEAQTRDEGGARFVVRLPLVEPSAVPRHGTRSQT
jgi:two-component system NtrC family sensor kinase